MSDEKSKKKKINAKISPAAEVVLTRLKNSRQISKNQAIRRFLAIAMTRPALQAPPKFLENATKNATVDLSDAQVAKFTEFMEAQGLSSKSELVARAVMLGAYFITDGGENPKLDASGEGMTVFLGTEGI